MSKQLTVRVDDDVKPEFEKLCKKIGISVSNAVNIYMVQSVRRNGFPFPLSADESGGYTCGSEERREKNEETLVRRKKDSEDDKGSMLTFEEYCEKNKKQLDGAELDLKNGKGIKFTVEEFKKYCEGHKEVKK